MMAGTVRSLVSVIGIPMSMAGGVVGHVRLRAGVFLLAVGAVLSAFFLAHDRRRAEYREQDQNERLHATGTLSNNGRNHKSFRKWRPNPVKNYTNRYTPEKMLASPLQLLGPW
jgi:hypothetical protein